MSGQLRRNWFKVSLTGGLYLIVLVTISLQSPSSSFTWLITPIIFGISFIDWFATKVKTVVDVNLYALNFPLTTVYSPYSAATSHPFWITLIILVMTWLISTWFFLLKDQT
ncbi:hypothetical protein [Secundilactobacillus kimchicus]|uniref:Uncharacterized protein n=1 Tax=Secundilactobacillus kimchicus JCM 15530 TaxID=1302272 RepID=A0A0R1HYL5_9LACO|nr:hypothetical protein [Secundilactobacillus kimchicus]KRK48594.1 hypothetical protein FC96_GL001707 [Secundilactobacillus kimchicus JCM 15530]MBT9671339.1 hypothetical protein [Secundilactobacillus kimchicus]